MKTISLLIIFIYQRFISPIIPSQCRYYPSCSSYAHTAITIHGPFKGWMYTFKRLLKCHPFTSGGIDHVPKKERI